MATGRSARFSLFGWAMQPYLPLLAVIAAAGSLYFFRIGMRALDDSEAYAAYAASQKTVALVLGAAWRFDTGKPGFYHVLLHWFCAVFGNSETSLRGFSALFAIAQIPLLYAIGIELFEPEVALTATILWSFSPLAMIFAQWARMYSLYTAGVMANLLILWRLREKPGWLLIAASAITGAAMLSTHLCTLLFIAASVSLLLRDLSRGRKNAGAWAGIALGLALSAPLIPIALPQARELLFGHALDWIAGGQGAAAGRFGFTSAVEAAVLAAAGIALLFGRAREADEREPIRWCLMWIFVPIAPFVAANLLIRPLFALRYVAPAGPALALVAAEALCRAGARTRNLATAAMVTASVVVFVQTQTVRYQPWRQISRRVATASASEPVFFEEGLPVSNGDRAAEQSERFSQGYLRPAFDYYFKGSNPRIAFDPADIAGARELIARGAVAAGGAWLVSCKSDAVARREMPDGIVASSQCYSHVCLYHIVPRKVSETLAPARSGVPRS